jgi:hypothetical protein
MHGKYEKLTKNFGQKGKGGDNTEETSAQRRILKWVSKPDTHTQTQVPARSVLGPAKVKLSL